MSRMEGKSPEIIATQGVFCYAEYVNISIEQRLRPMCIRRYIRLAIYQLMVDIYKFPRLYCHGLLMALA